MKKRIKFLTFTICAAILCTSPYSCANSKHNTSHETTQADSDVKTANPTDTQEPITINYTLPYYDIVEDKNIEYNGTETFYGKIRYEFFAEKLSELMEMPIAVKSITADGSKITVDFSSDGIPIRGIGSYGETAVLDSLASVLLNTFHDISSIYITADGMSYESGHISQPKEMPYATRKESSLG